MTDAELIRLLKSEIQDLQDQLEEAQQTQTIQFDGRQQILRPEIGTVRKHRAGYRPQINAAGIPIWGPTKPTKDEAQAWLDDAIQQLGIVEYRDSIRFLRMKMRKTAELFRARRSEFR